MALLSEIGGLGEYVVNRFPLGKEVFAYLSSPVGEVGCLILGEVGEIWGGSRLEEQGREPLLPQGSALAEGFCSMSHHPEKCGNLR